jgi:hypothetical protein
MTAFYEYYKIGDIAFYLIYSIYKAKSATIAGSTINILTLPGLLHLA